MSQYGSWSVKGVDDRARAVAKEKARLKGITLGDYINNLLLEGHSEAGPRDYFESAAPSHRDPFDGLAKRIEAVEARSTLAITGIDQSVLGLLARLDNAENSTSAMAAEVERMIDELRETHETLHEKVGALETDETGRQNLEAMKALEDALGKLASHVYEEGRLTQDETMAMKGRVEAGFGDLSERVEGMEVKVENTLAEAAQRVEKAVEQAELRAEGTSRHLSERFSHIESNVVTKLSKVDEVDARMKAVEGDMSGAITSMESTLARIQDRLHRAETTTDTALKALEHTFANLDARIDNVAAMASPEKAEAWRQELERRFDEMAADLRSSVDETRRQLAVEIENAAARANPELMGEFESRIYALEGTNTAEQIESFGEQVATLSDTLEKRIGESERRSANAIEQVGEQVATAIKHVQVRQEQGQRALEDKVTASEKRQETRLSDALSNISDRLTEMQNQTATAVSPVQRAIVSLASRLEALEDFSAPPHAEPVSQPLPDLPELEVDTSPIELDEVAADDPFAEDEIASEFSEPIETESISADEFDENHLSEDEFMAGLPDFDDEERALEPQTHAEEPPVEEWEAAKPDVDEDYTPEENPHADTTNSENNADADPLAELGGWNDSQDESRDSDVFSDDEPFGDLLPAFAEDDLAHNADAVEDDIYAEDDGPKESDQDKPADYLSRARNAAIAAATDPAREKRGLARRLKSGSKPESVGRFGKNKKLPIIAAASAFAIAAAGASGWVALRGKQVTADANAPTITTKTELAEANAEQIDEPSLSGVEFAASTSIALEETLFEEQGSVDPAELIEPAVPVEVAEPVILPTIPNALTVETAARNGNPIAEYQFGQAQLEAQNLAVGADFISRAAAQGLPAAQYRLAKLHERGIGVPRDLTEARAWTERAAVGGNVKAMHDLAVFFADGEGGAQSYAAAAEWFRKAADFGIVDSQFNLAVLYENGLGISPSQVEALYWYEVATANGDATAPSNVATLRDVVSLSDAQQAQRRAANWSIANLDQAANGQFGLQTWDRSSRAQVEAVQTVLGGLGYDAGTPDGIAGPGTRTAIRAFQADYGLETNGVIDDQLVDALNTQAQSLAG
ncbi:MAG: peptidoglycan-binding protein [Pseudomonadota bacterium]